MKKRCLALALALMLSVAAVPFASAETEYASVSEVLFSRDYENGTLTAEENKSDVAENPVNTIVDSADAKKALKVNFYKITGENGAPDVNVANNVQYDFEAITDDLVEISFKILPMETDAKGARFYMQFLSGSQVSLQLQFDSSAATSRYAMLVSSTELLSRTDLNHVAFSAQSFNAADFNDVKIILKRERDGSNAATGGKMELYLNGTAKHPEGGYDITGIGTGCKFKDNTINRLRMYYVQSGSYNNPPQAMLIDDVSISTTRQVPYDADEMSMSFETAMDYSGSAPKIKISNGTDSAYLQQSMVLSLVNAENEAEITEVKTVSAEKTEDSKASFSFEEEISVAPGWYFAEVKRTVGGAAKGQSVRQKLYIASTEQLASLAGDFSNLPENITEAMAKVEYYLPCFLTEEEINTLFPKESGAYTDAASANLSFITKYFQSSSDTYSDVPAVQGAFGKAKGYLKLKNAVDNAAVRETLLSGGYLADYLENDIFTDNEEAFFSHFNPKRLDTENPLVSDSAIANALRYSMAMTALNVAKRSEIEALVSEYNDVYGIELDAEGVSEVSADDLYAALYNKSYTDVSAIQADWSAKLTELLNSEDEDESMEEEKETTSSGGGGGGGGGGGRVIKATDIAEPAPLIAPEETSVKAFDDIKGHWAEKDINAMQEKGIVTGFEDGTFRPEANLTRAELVVMLARILPEKTEKSDISFADVSSDDWFSAAVNEAVSAGIVNGTDGKFLPNSDITREQLAVMIYRALGVEGKVAEKADFADVAEISDYAQEAISYLASAGILSGYDDNTIRPKNNTTRAEAAKLLNALLSELSK